MTILTCKDTFLHAMSYLPTSEVAQLESVSKVWKSHLADQESYQADKKVFAAQSQIFGPKKWTEYFELQAISESPLPPRIDEILKEPCPFYPGKLVFETHRLIYIPGEIDNAPFTLNKLQALTEYKQKKGFEISIHNLPFNNHLLQANSHWILITKQIIPGGLNKTLEQQNFPVGYQAPNLMEAVIGVTVERMEHGESDNLTYTQTTNLHYVAKNRHRISLHPQFLNIHGANLGIVAVRRL